MQRNQLFVAGIGVEQVAPLREWPGRPPLLFVHGTAHGAWCWENWTQTLAEAGWECFALSLRNHPPSRAEDERYFCERMTVADFAEDVALVARHIGRPAVAIGHSMGGIVVQSFAQSHLRAGGTLAGLVLVAAVPPAPFGPLRDALLPTDRPLRQADADVRKFYFHDVDPAVLRWACERLVASSPSVLNEYSQGAGMPIDPQPFTFPKLVMTAADDHTVVPRDRRLADFYGADYVHVTRIGHDMMLERRWPEACRKLQDWLNAHFGSADGR